MTCRKSDGTVIWYLSIIKPWELDDSIACKGFKSLR